MRGLDRTSKFEKENPREKSGVFGRLSKNPCRELYRGKRKSSGGIDRGKLAMF